MAEPPRGADPCLFCGIASGASPSHRFYEDAVAVGFLDIFPFTRGHALVVPKRHIDRLTDLPPDERAPFVAALQNVCRRIERLTKDYNVALNQGAAAGQIIFHLHFHIIPRYGEGNPFRTGPRERLTDAEARDLLKVLSPAEPP